MFWRRKKKKKKRSSGLISRALFNIIHWEAATWTRRPAQTFAFGLGGVAEPEIAPTSGVDEIVVYLLKASSAICLLLMFVQFTQCRLLKMQEAGVCVWL